MARKIARPNPSRRFLQEASMPDSTAPLDFQVNRDDFRDCRFVSGDPGAPPEEALGSA